MRDRQAYRTMLEYEVLGACLNGQYGKCSPILSARNFKLHGQIKHSKVWEVFEKITPCKPVNIVTVALELMKSDGINYNQYLFELSNASYNNCADHLALALLELDIRTEIVKSLNDSAISLTREKDRPTLIDIIAIQSDLDNEQSDLFDIVEHIKSFLSNHSKTAQLSGLKSIIDLVPKRVNTINRWTKLKEVVLFLKSVKFPPLESKIEAILYDIEYFLAQKGGQDV